MAGRRTPAARTAGRHRPRSRARRIDRHRRPQRPGEPARRGRGGTMSTLGFDIEFARRDYPKLEPKVRERTVAAIRKFDGVKSTGGHLEKIAGARDNRLRSVRIDRFYRGIVLIPEGDDLFTLVKVLPHDDAYEWARRHVVSVNPAVGRVEFRDAATIEEVTPSLAKLQPESAGRLLDHVTDDVFDRFRIDDDVRRFARALTDDAQLEAAHGFLPEIQWQVLIGLAAHVALDDIWAELGAGEPDDSFDPDDLLAAIRRSPDRILLVDGPQELLEMLRRPFDLWRVALHPVQYQVAHGDFSGPARVTGGPGTGKTVVAMHRARHLAAVGEGPVLLTTFTSTLAASLQAGVDLLVESAEVRDRISVRHIDQVAHEVFRQRHGNPKIIDDAQLRKLWAELIDRLGVPYSATFLAEEWKHVVLAQEVGT
ncbi:MAG: AAA family ATPase, partial [Streptosporangiales bacterium]|nr:AAA family ATPase [Streptosporangiales bacterium]